MELQNGTKTREQTRKKLCDDLLELLLIAYTYGCEDANEMIGTQIAPTWFVTSVEHSNPGFKVQWDVQPGDGRFVNCFTGRKIGVIFGQEEYEKQDGNIGKSTKPVRVCDYAKAAEAEIPPLKTMSAKNKKKAETSGFSGYTEQPMSTEEFMQVDAMTDPGLPFM